MAVTVSSGGHSPTLNTRNEKVFDEAQSTGFISLSGRKLKEYPVCSSKFDLSDTVTADLSKNRFADIPPEVCRYESLERLNCYHNVIKCIPETLFNLHALVHLNLGRNQMTVLPPMLCELPSLEVLLVANNKLVSLPEEVGKLDKLMQLDVSCNEITHLPTQIGEMKSLNCLNVRRNLLVELPAGMSRMKMIKFDFSSNKISEIPSEMHTMQTLQDMRLDHNPLTCPPAHLCTKGLGHIRKYLFIQALKEDRKRGMMSDAQLRKTYRKSGVPSNNLRADNFHYNGSSPRDRRKRNTGDSGYNTTDSSDKTRWSPSEVNNGDLEEANSLALRAAESVKEQRQERELQRRKQGPDSTNPPVHRPAPSATVASQNSRPALKVNAHHPHAQNHIPGMISAPVETKASMTSPLSNHNSSNYTAPPSQSSNPPHLSSNPASPPNLSSNPVSPSDSSTNPSPKMFDSPKDSRSSPATPTTPSSGQGFDEFTRELQRQKAEYEAKKKRAEQLRLERERDEDDLRERDERRRAALRLQEEQKAVLEKQRLENRSLSGSSVPNSISASSLGAASSISDSSESSQSSHSRLGQSNSFREEKKPEHQYRRTVSDTNYNSRYSSPGPDRAMGRFATSEENGHRNNIDVGDGMPSSEASPVTPDSATIDQPRVRYIPVIHNTLSTTSVPPQEDEFRKRHEAMINQQRHEAQLIQRRLEAQKQNILRMQQDMVQKWSSSPLSDMDSSTGGSTSTTNHKTGGLPPRCQKILESLGPELNSMNPAFTIRRNIQHAQEEIEKIEELRRTIESRLKVTLPENLPAALKDGVVLCHLANHIRPRSVSSIHVPSPAVPKLPIAKCRRNVENFLEACRRIGVEQDKLFAPLDILDERDIFSVALMIRELMDIARIPVHSAV